MIRRIRNRRMRIDLAEIERERAPEQCSGGLSYGGSMAGVLELSNIDLQCTIRRNKKIQGERGRNGELIGPEHREREAVEAVRRELAAEVDGGAGSKLGYGD